MLCYNCLRSINPPYNIAELPIGVFKPGSEEHQVQSGFRETSDPAASPNSEGSKIKLLLAEIDQSFTGSEWFTSETLRRSLESFLLIGQEGNPRWYNEAAWFDAYRTDLARMGLEAKPLAKDQLIDQDMVASAQTKAAENLNTLYRLYLKDLSAYEARRNDWSAEECQSRLDEIRQRYLPVSRAILATLWGGPFTGSYYATRERWNAAFGVLKLLQMEIYSRQNRWLEAADFARVQQLGWDAELYCYRRMRGSGITYIALRTWDRFAATWPLRRLPIIRGLL